jgi:two-component sensor histidine kinase
LAAVLDQSLDCIKLIAPDGTVQFMNSNGLCAMEIDSLKLVAGRPWVSLWPEASQPAIRQALKVADDGFPVRFDAFCPTAKGSPRWWDVSVTRVADAAGQNIGYLSVSRDVTEARLNKEVAEIAVAEMRHRLKNSYAMVAGLLSALARGNPEREEFVGEIRERLRALGVAQTLFVSTEHAPCNIRDLLPALLEPFSHPDCEVVASDLPDATLDQGQADALALVVGELAVNSTKHGALKGEGRVRVTGQTGGGALKIIWDEESPRTVSDHAREGGQGLRLIQRILNARDGKIDLVWRTRGLVATVSFTGLSDCMKQVDELG